MGCVARGLMGLAIASAGLAAPCVAGAQEPGAAKATADGEVTGASVDSAAPPEARVRLALRGSERGLRYSLYPLRPRDAAPLVTCGEGCQLELPRGRYRIEVSGPAGSDVHTDSNVVSISEDTTLEVDPASRSGRRSGLAMGITGSVLIPVGLMTLLVGAMIEWFDEVECDPAVDPCTEDPVTPVIWVGLGMVATGAVLTPVGWSRFARSRKPRFVEVSGAASAALGPTQPWFGPRRVGSGYGLGAGFRF